MQHKHQKSRSHTKSGPGRSHGQCRLIVDPTNGDHLGVRSPVSKHPLAVDGGNWQGKEYLSYREHDRINRLCGFPSFMKRGDALKQVRAERAASAR